MISTEQFDEMVKLKRKGGGRVKKCKPGQPCRDQKPSPGAPPIPVPTDPERSAFAAPGTFIPTSIFQRATTTGDYVRQLSDLSSEMFNVQKELVDYQNRINSGSHSGLGQYINEGNQLLQQLNYHHDRTRHKQILHQHLNLSDLQMLYNHAVHFRNQAGMPHPPSHPKDSSLATSRTALIEALTHEYDGYGHEPMGVLQYYHSLSSPPPPPPLTP